MAEIDVIDGPLKFSIRRLAVEMDMDRAIVAKHLQTAGVEPAGTRNGHPVYLLKDALRACFAPSGPGPGEPGFTPERLAPKDRRDWWASEVDRLRVEEKAGHLVPASAVETEMGALIQPLAAALETLPDILERDAGLLPEQVERVQQVLDSERQRLYEALRG